MQAHTFEIARDDNLIVNQTRDATRGYVAVSACAAGWSAELAVEMGRVAEPSVTSRMIAGIPARRAIEEGVIEVELMAAMEVFATALAHGAAPQEAFETVMDVVRKSMANMIGFQEAITAARHSFDEAVLRGLSPYAALIAADIAAHAAVRLVVRSMN